MLLCGSMMTVLILHLVKTRVCIALVGRAVARCMRAAAALHGRPVPGAVTDRCGRAEGVAVAVAVADRAGNVLPLPATCQPGAQHWPSRKCLRRQRPGAALDEPPQVQPWHCRSGVLLLRPKRLDGILRSAISCHVPIFFLHKQLLISKCYSLCTVLGLRLHFCKPTHFNDAMAAFHPLAIPSCVHINHTAHV